MKEIEGKVSYHQIGLGFWGITDKQGRNWRPDEIPPALKRENLQIKAKVEELPEQVSVEMWGTAVRIRQYEIID